MSSEEPEPKLVTMSWREQLEYALACDLLQRGNAYRLLHLRIYPAKPDEKPTQRPGL